MSVLCYVLAIAAVNGILAVPSHDKAGSLDMVSGLAASQRHAHLLYAVNDNAGEGVYMLDARDGSVMGVLVIQHGEEYDWEDIAVGPCPDYDSCIFVADTGERAQGKSQNTIYRVKEPELMFTQDVPLSAKYEFTWGAEASSAIVVDPSGNVFLFSQERNIASKVYELPPNGWNSASPAAARFLTNFPSLPSPNLPLAADLSADGKHLLVKTLHHVYEWEMPDGNVIKALATHDKDLHYAYEHEGESIAWASDGHGFYTIGQGTDQVLHYHSYP